MALSFCQGVLNGSVTMTGTPEVVGQLECGLTIIELITLNITIF